MSKTYVRPHTRKWKIMVSTGFLYRDYKRGFSTRKEAEEYAKKYLRGKGYYIKIVKEGK